MKKIFAVLVVFFASIVAPANAAEPMKTIVIIDTGYDNTVAQFYGKVVYEKCLTNAIPSCPNGKSNQEGYGAAALSKDQLSVFTADHGTHMLATSILTNPKASIIFVRTASISKNQIVYPTEIDITQVLSWVYLNRNKMNIGAVVLSASRSVNSCNPPAVLYSAVQILKGSGIPTIMAAGNDYNYKSTGYPACMSNVISVGATDNAGISLFSNYSKDFYATGTLSINIYNRVEQIAGTSEAAQVFAANWVAIRQAKPTLTYADQYALIKKTATLVSNQYVKNMPAINLANALK